METAYEPFFIRPSGVPSSRLGSKASVSWSNVSGIGVSPIFAEVADIEVQRDRDFRRHPEPILGHKGGRPLAPQKSVVGADCPSAFAKSAVVCSGTQILG